MKAKKIKKWTEEENQLLKKRMEEFPFEKTMVFNLVAIQTKRSVTSVAAHWYNVLQNPMSPQYVGSLDYMLARDTMYDKQQLTQPKKKHFKTLDILTSLLKKLR